MLAVVLAVEQDCELAAVSVGAVGTAAAVVIAADVVAAAQPAAVELV